MASEKERVALGSIAASAGLAAAKAVVGLLSGSLAILSEAAHALLRQSRQGQQQDKEKQESFAHARSSSLIIRRHGWK